MPKEIAQHPGFTPQPHPSTVNRLTSETAALQDASRHECQTNKETQSPEATDKRFT